MKEWWYYNKEEFLAYVTIILLSCALIWGSLRLTWWLSETSCLRQTTDIGYNARWDKWTDCQIEVKPGQWIPLDSYYFKEE